MTVYEEKARGRHLHGLAARVTGDEALTRRAARGDVAAFSVLYGRYQQPLYRYCRSLVGEDDAADVMQAAMTSAWTALQGETRALTFKPWLYRIAHNESISMIRRRTAKQPLHDDDACSTDVSGIVIAQEELRQLVDDLRSLPERQRGALVMRELSDLAYEEIAVALGMSGPAARQTVYEARVALHELREGRQMDCEDARRSISDRDGRKLRSRRMRAHLARCEACVSFRRSLRVRKAAMALTFPAMPADQAAAASAQVLGELSLASSHAASAALSGGAAATTKATVLAKAVLAKAATAKIATAVAVSAVAAGGGVAAVQQDTRVEPKPAHRFAGEGVGTAGTLVAGQAASASGSVELQRLEQQQVVGQQARARQLAAARRRAKAAAARERAEVARVRERSQDGREHASPAGATARHAAAVSSPGRPPASGAVPAPKRPPAPVRPAPVAPAPVAPTPVAPTPVAPAPVAPAPVAPAPVAPAPVAPPPKPTASVPAPAPRTALTDSKIFSR